jgi:hypothetical protein
MLINGPSPRTHASCPGGIDARTKLCFGSVVHSDHYPPREDVDEVANLATVSPNDRFDTLRPTPSRLMGHAPDLDTTQFHELGLALVKGSCFLRRSKALFHDLCHVAPPPAANASSLPPSKLSGPVPRLPALFIAPFPALNCAIIAQNMQDSKDGDPT